MQLKGDLNQMAIQKGILEGWLEVSNTIPPEIDDSEDKDSIDIFWMNKIAGWWNYKDELIEYGICTEEEYINELKLSVDRNR